VVAVATVVVVLSLLYRAIRSSIPPARRLPIHILAGLVLVQAALGITTLLFSVPIDLAAAHQSAALVLFAAAIWVAHGLSGSMLGR
jgi:cytochrome c oxidase assembly protein subunit 15